MGRFAFILANGQRVSVRSVPGSEYLEVGLNDRYLGVFVPSACRWTNSVDMRDVDGNLNHSLKEIETGLSLVDKQRRDGVRRFNGSKTDQLAGRFSPHDGGETEAG